MLFFFGVLLKLSFFFHPVIPQFNATDGFLYLQLLKWLQPAGNAAPVIYPLIAFLLFFLQAITLNSFINDLKLFSTPHHLTGFSYLLVTSLLPEWNTLSPGLIINTIMIGVLPMMIELRNQQKVKGKLFNIGMGFGICSFVYFPSLYFIVLLILALALFRPIQITEWLVTIVGLVTPFYFLLVYFFVWDQWKLVSEIVPPHRILLPGVNINWSFWVTVSLVLFPALVGLLVCSRYTVRLVLQVRKSWRLMLYYLLIALFIPFVNNYSGLNHFILSVVPLSIFTAAFYSFPRKKSFMEFTVWVTIGWIGWQYLVPSLFQ